MTDPPLRGRYSFSEDRGSREQLLPAEDLGERKNRTMSGRGDRITPGGFGARLARRLLSLGLLAFLVATSGWLLVNSLHYFAPRVVLGDELAPFLVEKGAVALESGWRAMFTAHIVGGIACLCAGPFLVWNLLLLRSRRAHIAIGRAYVVFVLAWGAPAGLVLSFTAKGGWAGQSGFFILGVLWWVTSFLGLREIRARRTVPHIRWMLRSYALATSALTFRVFHVAFYFAGVPDRSNYIASIWASLAVSLLAGELCAARARHLAIHSAPLSRSARSRRSAANSRANNPPPADDRLLEKGVLS